MTQGPLEFTSVTFYYDSAASPICEGLSVRFDQGWTGIIGANGAGKTTLLRLACGELTPTAGRIRTPTGVVYCPQRTDDPPAELDRFMGAADPAACSLRGQLALADDWPCRWPTLSHGERKRAQIAVALWLQPQVLAVDEPTNHIDAGARDLLAAALRRFRGVGLLVSHDRRLLDGLCRQCLFVEPPGAVMRPGGYTKAVALAQAEHRQAKRQRHKMQRELTRLRREAASRQQEAARSRSQRSKRRVGRRDHDAKTKIDLARLTGKDGQAGRRLRQMDGRIEQARSRLDSVRVAAEHRLGIDMQAARSQRDRLFRLDGGRLDLGDRRRLVYPDLQMVPDDRIALVGPNGGGKSTLIRHIVGALSLPADKLVYIAQEIDAATARDVIADVRRLPNTELGDVMNVVSCLGSRPQRLMETELPSPGELRKLMLALGVARRPHLIIMDEPTNHLDLPSIECLEAALDQCPCGLLLVSHDMPFLDRLSRTRWEIAPDAPDRTSTRMTLRTIPPSQS